MGIFGASQLSDAISGYGIINVNNDPLAARKASKTICMERNGQQTTYETWSDIFKQQDAIRMVIDSLLSIKVIS